MFEGVLNQLLSDDLLAIASTISGAPALRQFFASREEVRKVAVAVDSVRRFTETLLQDLRRGDLFRHDLTLAALAVVLEGWFTPFAEKYLRELGELKSAEMPYGPRVAREVLAHRCSAPMTQPESAGVS